MRTIIIEVERNRRPPSQYQIVRPLFPMFSMLTGCSLPLLFTNAAWAGGVLLAMAGVTLCVGVGAWVVQGKRIRAFEEREELANLGEIKR